ncbi:hypothetical protein [Methylobacterium sp. SD21]|uniref:hypothetical protein n=1 Tax=Methylobacterium litchii TaxID=3138810 RepID=UPI00313C8A93
MPDAPAPTRAEEGREYVLIKRGLYWRPNGHGYTGLLSEAGRYSASEAAAHADHDNDSTRAWPADQAGEFAPSCWQETMLAFRTKERDEALACAAQAEAEVARLTAENERLRIAFHDATRRPLGVTPDSGAEFYDQRMADEAEERRVARSRQTVLRGLSREEVEARAAALGDAQRRERDARRGGADA